MATKNVMTRLFQHMLFGLCGILFHAAAQGQGTAVDSAYWMEMDNRIEKFMRAPLASYAVTVHRETPDRKMEAIEVNTIEEAFHRLGDHQLDNKGIFQLYDFLDSAATHFYRIGTPISIRSGDFSPRGGEWFINQEQELGVLIVYNYDAGCVYSRGQMNGEKIFNLRTDILVRPDAHPEPKKRNGCIKKTISRGRTALPENDAGV